MNCVFSAAGKKGVALKMDEDQLRILDEVPSSAVELQVKDKVINIRLKHKVRRSGWKTSLVPKFLLSALTFYFTFIYLHEAT